MGPYLLHEIYCAAAVLFLRLPVFFSMIVQEIR
jgi:hypothetical protein